MGATEGTKLTEDYNDMEKVWWLIDCCLSWSHYTWISITKQTVSLSFLTQKTDGLIELIDELLDRTKEYLQPNPATRAKLMLSSKVVQTKTHAYPQPEGTLGESMVRASKRLGTDSSYGMKTKTLDMNVHSCVAWRRWTRFLLKLILVIFVHLFLWRSLSSLHNSLCLKFLWCHSCPSNFSSSSLVLLLVQERVSMNVEKPWSRWPKSSMLWKTMSSRISWNPWRICSLRMFEMFKWVNVFILLHSDDIPNVYSISVTLFILFYAQSYYALTDYIWWMLLPSKQTVSSKEIGGKTTGLWL